MAPTDPPTDPPTDLPTDPPSGQLPAPRTLFGTLWRCAGTLLLALVALAAAAWLDAQFDIDGATASLPTTVVSLLLGAATVLWLRVGQAWILPVLLGADTAGLSAAVLISRGVLDGGQPDRARLTDGTLNEVLAGLAALGIAVLVVSVLWAAVRGHRHPAVPFPAKDPRAVSSRGAGSGGSSTPPEAPPGP
ncbi:hypothetical protein [Streptomyces sp. NBC_00370]|uniref:hypothetical protein n=1 Tax=Streptomyces sp. NBC_00370 TaxID=2975728 RepID=UPI002E255DCC